MCLANKKKMILANYMSLRTLFFFFNKKGLRYIKGIEKFFN